MLTPLTNQLPGRGAGEVPIMQVFGSNFPAVELVAVVQNTRTTSILSRCANGCGVNGTPPCSIAPACTTGASGLTSADQSSSSSISTLCGSLGAETLYVVGTLTSNSPPQLFVADACKPAPQTT